MFIKFFWKDPAIMKLLNSKEKKRMSLEDLEKAHDDGELTLNIPINPDLMCRHMKKLEAHRDTFEVVNGYVMWERYCDAVLFEGMELEEFPFDRQFLSLHFLIRSKHFRIRSTPFEEIPDKHEMRVPACYTLSDSIIGWEPSSPWILYPGEGNTQGEFAISLRITRDAGYYLHSLVFPLYSIIMLGMAVFEIPVDDIPDRISTTVSILLTAVAFKFVMADDVPRTTYFTLLEKYIIFSYVLLVLQVLESVVTFIIYTIHYIISIYTSPDNL